MAMKRVTHEISWATAGQVINAVIALITLKVWAVYLTPAELGIMALTISAASILAGIVVDPLARAMLVRYSVHAEVGRGKEFRVVGWAIVAKSMTVCIAAIVAIGVPLSYFLDLHWSTPLLVAGLFAVDARRCFEQTLLAARRRQRAVAMISVGDVCSRLMFLWLFLLSLGVSAHIAVAGNLLGALIALTLLLVITRSDDRPSISSIDGDIREQMRNEVLRIAWPIVPSNILANVSEMGSRYIIATMLDLHQAGIFVASYGLVKRPFGMLSDIGFTAMMPVYSEAIARNNSHAARHIKFIWLYGIAILSLIGAALFYVLGEPIVVLLLSRDYTTASDYFFGIATTVAILNICAVINGVLLAHGDSKSILIGNAVAAALTTTMMFALIPLYGLHGAVRGMGIGYLVQFTLLFVVSLRYSRYQISNLI